MGGGGFELGLMESGVLWLCDPVVAGDAGPGAAETARLLVPAGEGAMVGVPAPGDSIDC